MTSKTLIQILEDYKEGKEILADDLLQIEQLSMSGFIRRGYKFDQNTFLFTPTAITTTMGRDLLKIHRNL